MTNQELIDKYLSEFNEIQKLKVPIELNSYLHRMLDEALRIHVVSQRSEPYCFECEIEMPTEVDSKGILRCRNCGLKH